MQDGYAWSERRPNNGERVFAPTWATGGEPSWTSECGVSVWRRLGSGNWWVILVARPDGLHADSHWKSLDGAIAHAATLVDMHVELSPDGTVTTIHPGFLPSQLLLSAVSTPLRMMASWVDAYLAAYIATGGRDRLRRG